MVKASELLDITVSSLRAHNDALGSAVAIVEAAQAYRREKSGGVGLMILDDIAEQIGALRHEFEDDMQ
jgi:hypothetical protein